MFVCNALGCTRFWVGWTGLQSRILWQVKPAGFLSNQIAGFLPPQAHSSWGGDDKAGQIGNWEWVLRWFCEHGFPSIKVEILFEISQNSSVSRRTMTGNFAFMRSDWSIGFLAGFSANRALCYSVAMGDVNKKTAIWMESKRKDKNWRSEGRYFDGFLTLFEGRNSCKIAGKDDRKVCPASVPYAFIFRATVASFIIQNGDCCCWRHAAGSASTFGGLFGLFAHFKIT